MYYMFDNLFLKTFHLDCELTAKNNQIFFDTSTTSLLLENSYV